jgi:hypothetical protein
MLKMKNDYIKEELIDEIYDLKKVIKELQEKIGYYDHYFEYFINHVSECVKDSLRDLKKVRD